MITITGKDYRPNSLEVAFVEASWKGSEDAFELTAKAHPDLETGATVKLSLNRRDAHALLDYLRRALEAP
jgi:hypothetical protein